LTKLKLSHRIFNNININIANIDKHFKNIENGAASMDNQAVEVENLVKRFPQKSVGKNGDSRKSWWPFGKQKPKTWLTAVDGVSFVISTGEIFGLLGPNGAGKSTTIRMLCTLLEPTSGTARMNGYDIVRQGNRVRRSLGTVLAGERSIYWKLTGRENLEYFAALYHIPPKVARRQVEALLERMELSHRADELVEKYSTGMKQRIAIGKALLARPPILLLDEPTLGLDPQAARMVRRLISDLRQEGHTILLTTHYMEEADQLSDRIGIIDQGHIIALDTPSNLKDRIQHKDIIHLEITGWQPEMAQGLTSMPHIENMIQRQVEAQALWEVNLHTSNSRAALPGVIQHVNHNGSRLVNMNIVRPSLEDVFIHMTGKSLRD
jgi:ABC-2 type transport system ATP-binding protein